MKLEAGDFDRLTVIQATSTVLRLYSIASIQRRLPLWVPLLQGRFVWLPGRWRHIYELNPAWAALDAQLRQAWARVERLQSEYGLEALNSLQQKHRTMRGFKIAYGKLGEKIWTACQRVLELEKRRAVVPRRVPVQDAIDKPVVKLAPERKHLTNLIKMVAYQAESDLLRLVAPHYRRVDDEGRTLIQAALACPADLKVTKRELRLTLAPQSSPHRTRAIAALCEELNRKKTYFPGSSLRLHYATQDPP